MDKLFSEGCCLCGAVRWCKDLSDPLVMVGSLQDLKGMAYCGDCLVLYKHSGLYQEMRRRRDLEPIVEMKGALNIEEISTPDPYLYHQQILASKLGVPTEQVEERISNKMVFDDVTRASQSPYRRVLKEKAPPHSTHPSNWPSCCDSDELYVS